MPSKTKAAGHDAANDDAIKTRAYYLWEADGRPHGKHDHYWFIAAEEAKAAAALGANGSKKAAAAKATPVEAAPIKAAAKPVKAKVAAAEAPKAVKKAATRPRAAVPAK